MKTGPESIVLLKKSIKVSAGVGRSDQGKPWFNVICIWVSNLHEKNMYATLSSNKILIYGTRNRDNILNKSIKLNKLKYRLKKCNALVDFVVREKS